VTPTLWRDLAGVLVFAAALGMSVVLGTFTAWPVPMWVGIFTLAGVARISVELALRREARDLPIARAIPLGEYAALRCARCGGPVKLDAHAEPDLPLFDQAPALDPNRCAVCGWTMSPVTLDGVRCCMPGDCRRRPPPETFYDRERAIREYAPHAPPTPEYGRREPGR